MSSAPGSGPFVDADTLARELAAAHPPTLLDVRWSLGGPPGAAEHAAGHLPGAAYVDLDTELAAPDATYANHRGRHPLPGAEDLAAAMRRAGLRAGHPVVVYDGATGVAAARCWWLLRHHGHRDVRVLDGGYAAWQASGQPVERGPVAPEPGDFVSGPGDLSLLAQEDVLTFVRDGLLLDARTPERFRGEAEPVDPVAGHVPGAVNLPTTALLGPDGRVRPADQVRALVAAARADAGAARTSGVAAYCGSGVTAAHSVLVLEHAGIPASLQAESWSGWVADPARPVATGA